MGRREEGAAIEERRREDRLRCGRSSADPHVIVFERVFGKVIVEREGSPGDDRAELRPAAFRHPIGLAWSALRAGELDEAEGLDDTSRRRVEYDARIGHGRKSRHDRYVFQQLEKYLGAGRQNRHGPRPAGPRPGIFDNEN